MRLPISAQVNPPITSTAIMVGPVGFDLALLDQDHEQDRQHDVDRQRYDADLEVDEAPPALRPGAGDPALSEPVIHRRRNRARGGGAGHGVPPGSRTTHGPLRASPRLVRTRSVKVRTVGGDTVTFGVSARARASNAKRGTKGATCTAVGIETVGGSCASHPASGHGDQAPDPSRSPRSELARRSARGRIRPSGRPLFRSRHGPLACRDAGALGMRRVRSGLPVSAGSRAVRPTGAARAAFGTAMREKKARRGAGP